MSHLFSEGSGNFVSSFHVVCVFLFSEYLGKLNAFHGRRLEGSGERSRLIVVCVSSLQIHAIVRCAIVCCLSGTG